MSRRTKVTGTLHKSRKGYRLRAITTITASASWTRPPWCKAVEILVTAGGGGGGTGGSTYQGSGGGGGAGACGIAFIDEKTLTNATETVTVGLGGSGASSNTNNAVAGGASSFGSHVTANGGPKGSYEHNSTQAQYGTANATCSGANINITAGHAWGCNGSTTTNGFGGDGGGNFIGTGGRGGWGSSTGGYAAKDGTGCGGGASQGVGVPGDGGNGVVVVWEYE